MAALPEPTQPTVDAIYAAYESAAGSGFRTHLGASVVGHECDRNLWLTFRWAQRAEHTGRLLRLFETGQLEEARLVANLRAAGVNVYEIDEATGQQHVVSAVRDHFGGSLDGIAIGILEAPKTWHVLEFKTHAAKSFADLKKKGVAASKPMHFAQMQVYMHLSRIDRAFYLARNKDTDELYSERVRHDPVFAERLIIKAERVIDATRPPPRISDDPSYFVCKLCSFSAVCFHERRAERNCRTCIHSSPVDHGRWHCARHDRDLSTSEQKRGCITGHRYIPDLVGGEQVDVRDEDKIVYRLASGEEWADAGA